MREFASGLHLAEAPRWHDGRLWISDMWDHKVWSFDADGGRRLEHDFGPDEDPGGLGWLPDGRLLVVGMEGRRVYRSDGADFVVHAELADHSPWQCNDMTVAPDGTAYVSHFGWDLFGRTTPYALTTLLRITPDGTVAVAALDLASPNGITIRDGGRSLVVSESGASKLTSFRIGADGSLHDRATFADLPPAAGVPVAPPDGICSDADGGIWIGEPIGRRVLRVDRAGHVTDEMSFDVHPLAVCLGGADRRTLFVCLAGQHEKLSRRPEPMASVVAVDVDVPGAGIP